MENGYTKTPHGLEHAVKDAHDQAIALKEHDWSHHQLRDADPALVVVHQGSPEPHQMDLKMSMSVLGSLGHDDSVFDVSLAMCAERLFRMESGWKCAGADPNRRPGRIDMIFLMIEGYARKVETLDDVNWGDHGLEREYKTDPGTDIQEILSSTGWFRDGDTIYCRVCTTPYVIGEGGVIEWGETAKFSSSFGTNQEPDSKSNDFAQRVLTMEPAS